MNSDIKLKDNVLTFEGDRIEVTAPDFELDSLDRRPGTDPNALRRALVHNEQDGLTINFNNDYPNGVTINNLTVEGSITSIHTTDLMLDNPGRRKTGGSTYRRALVHDFQDGLTINYANDYRSVTIQGNIHIDQKNWIAPAPHDPALNKFPDGTFDLAVPPGELLPIEDAVTINTERQQYERVPIDLGVVIGELVSKIAVLENRIAKLEAKP